MSQRGRHSSGEGGSFYRDLTIMILGILLVGAAVFFLLYLIADNPGATSSTTTTTNGSATSSTGGSSTTEATTPSTTTPTSSTSTTVAVRPPAEVRVVVLNSVGIAGAAGRLTDRLEAAGYQTLPAGDFEPLQDTSRIWYRDGFSVEANELLFYVPGATVEELGDGSLEPGADVVIVLGAGYEG